MYLCIHVADELSVCVCDSIVKAVFHPAIIYPFVYVRYIITLLRQCFATDLLNFGVVCLQKATSYSVESVYGAESFLCTVSVSWYVLFGCS